MEKEDKNKEPTISELQGIIIRGGPGSRKAAGEEILRNKNRTRGDVISVGDQIPSLRGKADKDLQSYQVF